MRPLGAPIVTVVVTAAVLFSPLAPATAHPSPPQTCRQQWDDLAQFHGENGNPGGSGATRPLQQRWDRYFEEAARLGREATAKECAGIGAYSLAWDGLERLMYGLHRHDYLHQLRFANGDLHHYQEFNGHNPSRQVMRAFKFLRQQAPKAAGDLKPVIDAAGAVSTANRVQVTGYLRDYRAAARASGHAVKAKKWLQIIEGAELGEE